jgi:hypothetical protein
MMHASAQTRSPSTITNTSPGTQAAGLDLDRLSVPQYAGVGGQVGSQGLHRPFRLKLLNECKTRVQQDHGDDRRGKDQGTPVHHCSTAATTSTRASGSVTC